MGRQTSRLIGLPVVRDLLAAVVGRFAAVYSDAPIEKVRLRKAAIFVFT